MVPEVICRVLEVFVHEHAEMSEGLSFRALGRASSVSISCDFTFVSFVVRSPIRTNREKGSPIYRLHQHGGGPATQRVAGARAGIPGARVLEVGAGSDQNPMLPS